jgi:MFS family permease
MIVQAGALGLLVAGDGAFAPSLAGALLLGVGTAMVYPTLIAAVSDASQPRDRARVVGVYRFWRDFGFVLGALIAGVGADATSAQTAILIVARSPAPAACSSPPPPGGRVLHSGPPPSPKRYKELSL